MSYVIHDSYGSKQTRFEEGSDLRQHKYGDTRKRPRESDRREWREDSLGEPSREVAKIARDWDAIPAYNGTSKPRVVSLENTSSLQRHTLKTHTLSMRSLPQLVSYNKRISQAAKLNRVEECRSILKEIYDARLHPDVFS